MPQIEVLAREQRHRRQEEAGERPEEVGAPRRCPGHSSDERACERRRGQQQEGEDDEVTGIDRCHPEDPDGCRRQPYLAPVIPGLGRQALRSGEAGWRVDRLGARLGKVRPEDRVEGDILELDGLDAIPWA